MPIQSAALELLIAFAPVANRWGRWYVFGAQAVILYGVPRLSADVDVTLALEPDAPDRFVVDMAAEMSNLTRQQILMQSGTAMLAQANSQPQNVLSLFR